MANGVPPTPGVSGILAPFLALALLPVLGACAGGEGGPGDAQRPDGITVTGFQTPESVLHDTAADVYLVSNINGEPLAEDGNGFISRVDPGGEVVELRWIDGATEGVTLNAPKGMTVIGDSLFVTDITCVRVFHRVEGEQLDSWCKDTAVFLNDIAVGPNGELFVTDSGSGEEGAEGPDAGALYRFDLRGRVATLATGPQLGRPNGVGVGPRGIFVVSMGSGEIAQFTAGGERRPVVPPSDRQLDGIVFTPDQGFLFSSWGDRAVYRVDASGSVDPIFQNLTAPADIGYDIQRNRVLVPLFQDDEVLILDLP